MHPLKSIAVVLASVALNAAHADEMHLEAHDFQSFLDGGVVQSITGDSSKTNVGNLSTHGATLTVSGNP